VSKLDTYLGLVKRLITSLNREGIDYMFTGAIVASYYDTPLNHEHNLPKGHKPILGDKATVTL